MNERLRGLPSVRAVLEDARVCDLPRGLATSVARDVLDQARAAVKAGERCPDVPALVAQKTARLLSGRLRPVLNATGVVLHTNLGRAPWGQSARDAAAQAMGYCNLELDLHSGARGERLAGIEALCRHLTGCEAAVAVNNGAAALLLAVQALAGGGEVIVARGELVEIGGSFRIPDVVATGGAVLREVGSTNRTRGQDLRAAVGPNTAAFLSVHPSNFRVVGFTSAPTRSERVAIARDAGVPIIEDVGSGDLTGALGEPAVEQAIAAGVDVVVFSGDKLLGGPQAGLAVGSLAAISRLRRHPLYRALRLDKVGLAALEATLADRARGVPLPVDELMGADAATLTAKAHALCDALVARSVSAEVVLVDDVTGGGARPDVALPSAAVRVSTAGADRVARALRLGGPSVLVRVQRGALLLHPRTLPDTLTTVVAERVATAVGAG